MLPLSDHTAMQITVERECADGRRSLRYGWGYGIILA